MKSVYEIIQAQGERYMAVIGAIQTEQPVVEDAAREVGSKFSRGGFLRTARVGLDRTANKASLFVCARDTKVRDTGEDAFGYTNIKIANYEQMSGFIRNNALFEAVLSKTQYAACMALGISPPGKDIKGKIVVDFRRARLFPLVDTDINTYHTILAQRQREATCDALRAIRDWAMDYLRGSSPTFAAKHPTREMGVSDPNLKTVKAYYTAFTTHCLDDSTEAAIDASKYRRDIRGERKLIKGNIDLIKKERKELKSKVHMTEELAVQEASLQALKDNFGSHCVYTCTPKQFDVLDADYQAAVAAVKVNAVKVRLMELGLLESFSSGTMSLEGKRLELRTETAIEYFRATSEAIDYWKQFNGHRMVPDKVEDTETLADAIANETDLTAYGKDSE